MVCVWLAAAWREFSEETGSVPPEAVPVLLGEFRQASGKVVIAYAIEADFEWPGGGRSIYFRDPAGNCLEFAEPRIWKLA